MEYREKLVAKIESFYVDIIEEFKEGELKIMADSKFRSMFKKKDYDGNIEMMRASKKNAQKISFNTSEIPAKDEQSRNLAKKFEKCLKNFSYVCDCHIQLQLALKKKANKQELKFSEYRESFERMQEARNKLNQSLHELDIVYTDYTYDEDSNPYTFLD